MTCTQTFLRKGLPYYWRSSSSSNSSSAVVGQWLLATGGMVVAMIHVGGLTRLTQSGLSMTSWSPLGTLPPLTRQQWRLEFERYQQFPEFAQRQNMTLKEFQYIYAWEYGHRMLGRVVGLVYVLPWMYLSVRGKIPRSYQPRLFGLLAMGGTQGLVGWWMVKSGLGEDRRGDVNEIRVKPVRLAAHLTMAVATYGALVWTGLDFLSLPNNAALKDQVAKLSQDALRQASRLRTGSLALTALTALTITSGALVAGNDAGRAYNTFPKMGDEWIPSDIFELVPWQRNILENTATVQFNHRVLGSATAVTALALAVAGLGLVGPNKAALIITPQTRKGLYAVGLAATGQFTLGVTTLLTYVPLSLAAAHQLGSIIVFTSSVYLAHSLRYARPALLRAGKSSRSSLTATNAASAVAKAS